MDISVIHLNRRMALQLPAEFPLGLVFVVGNVQIDGKLASGDSLQEFYLLEDDHRLLCRLSERAAEEISLNNGDLIRAGGHLAFDAATARYCLLARDIELLREYEPPSSTLGEIVAISRQKPVDDLAPAVLPLWVRELAPTEIQEEWAARRLAEAGAILITSSEPLASEEDEATPMVPPAVAVESWQEFVAGDVSLTYSTVDPALAELSDDLIDFLSEAIDSSDVIELTPAVLAEFAEPEPLAPDEVEETPQLTTPPDPKEAFAAQESSIEEFLIALETAISADEARSQQPAPAIESKNGQSSAELVSESVVETVAVEPPPPVEPVEQPVPGTLPQEKTAPKRQPKKRKKTSNSVPWFIVLLVIFAALFLFAIFVVLAINAGFLPLALN